MAKDGPVDLCLALWEYEADGELDEHWNEVWRQRDEQAMEDWRKVAELSKNHYDGNLRLVFGDVNDPSPPRCPSCVVCGELRTTIRADRQVKRG